MRTITPIPLASRQTYEVRAGDTIESITSQFVRPDRWRELVAVNQIHKGLVDGPPEAGGHMVFSGMQQGERLLIPASWLPSAGTVGAPPYQLGQGATQIGTLNPALQGTQFDPAGAFMATIVQNWSAIETLVRTSYPSFSVPTGYGPQDIANVMASWIPFLRAQGIDITQPPNSWSYTTSALLQSLINNAAVLLSTTQVASTVFRSVPWLSIPWGQVPWQSTVVQGNPAATSAVWDLIASASQPAFSGSAREPLFTGSGKFKVLSTPADLFNPAKTDFTAAPWASVPFGQIPWGSLDPSILKDADVQKCLADPNANARLQAMAAYKDCFIGAGADKLKRYLCPKGDGTYEDLSTCSAEPSPPAQTCPAGTTPVQTQAGQGCIPTIPGMPTINWSCSPYPDCIAQQVGAAWPAGVPYPCPPPGTAWPGCVTDVIANLGGRLPAPMVAQPKPEEPSNTGMYVALALGGAVLLGGLVYAASRPSAAPQQTMQNPARRSSRPSGRRKK